MAIYQGDGICSHVEIPPSAIDRLNSRINNLSSSVSTLQYEKASEKRVDGIDEVIENILEDVIPSIIEDIPTEELTDNEIDDLV